MPSRLLLLALFLFTTAAQAADTYTFGMVAKSQGNQFFEAARAGANDAARELGIPVGTVRSRLSRARQKLARLRETSPLDPEPEPTRRQVAGGRASATRPAQEGNV